MTMTYTFEQLKEDVRKEAEALREHATKDELGRLDIEQVDPTDPERCYYGLMTGECDSDRASELIQKCTTVFLINTHYENEVEVSEGFKKYKYSPIEYYIGLPKAKNKSLIAFLRGETDNLEL
jgi:hypothetical protein